MTTIVFMFSACFFSSEPKLSAKLFKMEIVNLSKSIASLEKECKVEENNKVDLKKIDGFITFSKKNSYSMDKIKTMNDELKINEQILYILQAYDSKDIKDFSKKKRCRDIVKNVNSTYNIIKKKLDYK